MTEQWLLKELETLVLLRPSIRAVNKIKAIMEAFRAKGKFPTDCADVEAKLVNTEDKLICTQSIVETFIQDYTDYCREG